MTDKDKIKNALLKYHVEHDKKFPPLTWICAYTKMTLVDIKKHLTELIDDGVISKYPTNHYLKKEFVESSKQKKDISRVMIDQAVSGIKAFVSKASKTKVSMTGFIRFMCFLIVIVAIYVTSSLSLEWTPIMMGEPFKAFMLSLMIPFFCTFSLEGAIILFKEKTIIAVCSGIVLLVMFLFATTFDASMIIMAQYNKRYTQVTAQNVTTSNVNKETKKYDLLNKQSKDQEKIVSELEIKLSGEKETLSKVEINTKEWSVQNRKVLAAENKRDTARKELKKIEDKILLQVEDTDVGVIQRDDGYTLIANRFGVAATDIEFILFSVLAVFLVIVAPFAGFVALGMWRKDHDKR